MSPAPRVISGWTRSRFLAVVGVLFVLQVGLIMLFGGRKPPSLQATAPSIRFRALSGPVTEQELLRLFFAGDPAVFPGPGPHGFSSRAWMDQRPEQYQPSNPLEPPSWLALNPARLATNFIALPAGSEPFPLGLAEQRTAQVEPLPAFLPPERIRAGSEFHIEGALGERLLSQPPLLTAWPSAQVLASSVVEIAVNPAGDVIAARLLLRSGSPDADKDALAKTRALRFRPSTAAPAITWCRAVFDWQTVELPAAAPQK
ncbi:MAG: energy transducer TonB [Verrucomicrobiota bacterium]|jgi:hypothetical protein